MPSGSSGCVPDLDPDELVAMRRQNPVFTVYDPLLGDSISVPALVASHEEPDEAAPEGPPEPGLPTDVPASNDDLRRYMTLRESLRAIQAEIKTLEPKVVARATETAGGVLLALRERELIARPRMFTRWGNPMRREEILREVGIWDDVVAYNWSKFQALYKAEPSLRDVLRGAVHEEQRFTLLVRRQALVK